MSNFYPDYDKPTAIAQELIYKHTQTIYNDIRRLCIEANKQHKNLAVSPLRACGVGPSDGCYYLKYKFDYEFLPYGIYPPAQWTLYDVAHGLPVEFGVLSA